MSSFNIHWRGCPNRNLPRIPSTSIRRSSIASRSLARTAAEDVMRLPLGAALERERRKQRSKVRSRRSRSSRCSTTLSRRRISYRASRNTHSFEKQLSRIYLNKIHAGDPKTKTCAKQQGTKSVSNDPTRSSNDTILYLEHHDGARSPARVPKPRTTDPDNVYSIMHVAEGSGYWTSNKPATKSRRSYVSDKTKHAEATLGGEYAHTGALESTNAQKEVSPRQNKWHRSYDPRIDPRCFTDGEDERAQLVPTQNSDPKIITAEPSPVRKDPDAEDAWETVDSTRFPPDNITSSNQTMTSVVPSLLSNSPYRTRSEAKRLNRFTKELELHYAAVKSLPKQNLLLSLSDTTVSAHTVTPLVPFHAEFQSAGLAVTSTEQRRLPNLKPIARNKNSGCLSMVADRRPIQGYGHDGQRSFASGTTGTTVLGFTPPHEKTYGRSGQSRARGSSTASGFTAVGFTPPHEKMMTTPARQAPQPSPTFTVKAPILWLDKDEKSPKSPLSPAKMSTVSARPMRNQDSKSPRSGEAPTTEYAWVPRPSTYKQRDSANNNVAERPQRDVTTQTEPLEVNYRQVATQTTVSDLVKPQRNEEKTDNKDVILIRAKRSNTFPSESAKCDEKCNRVEKAKAVETPGWIRSRLPWERTRKPQITVKGYTTGPEIIYTQQQEKINERQKEQSHSKSIEKPGDVSNEQQLGADSSRLRCFRCGALMDEDVESMDGQPQSNLSREPKCPQCSPSVYTAYVAPTRRAQYSQSRQSQKSATQDCPMFGANEAHSLATAPKANHDDGKGDGNVLTGLKNAEHSITEFAKMRPVVDPVKRSSMPSIWPSATTSPDSGGEKMGYFPPSPSKSQHQTRHGGADIKSKHLPSNHRQHHTQAKAGFKQTSTGSESRGKSQRSNGPSNQQVFHGLQVATAAACDEDLDKWIADINGSGVRHFLADLSKFEPLGVNTLSAVARKAAKQKKEQVRVWEKVREEKLKNESNKNKDGPGGQGNKNQPQEMENETDGKDEKPGDDWLVGDFGVKQK